jgi:hypothetical protein
MGAKDFTKIPNGAAGIEDRLAILYTHGVVGGRFSLEKAGRPGLHRAGAHLRPDEEGHGRGRDGPPTW